MCGINGFNWNNRELIIKMNEAVRHRGPDDSGIFLAGNISLGHQRLSIIDLSPNGHQPMTFEHLTVVFNGEIYNYREIKEELIKQGYSFFSGSDTEVILKSYHCWKEKCLDKFNGMFAFAIWDEKNQALFMARDRAGIKPLFYYRKNNKFIFSSEIKALLSHPDIDKTIVPERISYIYKMNCLPGDLTMFKNIWQLPAANYLLHNKDGLFIRRYWEINDYSDITDREEVKFQLREILSDSVRKQMISDVPLGVFLSGGIDSSIITYLASEYSDKVKTFSVGFEVAKDQDDKYNADFYIARKTADYFKTDHHEYFIKKGMALEYVEHMADNLEMPNGMTTAIPSYWLSKWAKKEVSVVLGGDGGDELFGGYKRYQLSLMLSTWFKLPGFLRKHLPANFIGRQLGKKDLAGRLMSSDYLSRYMSLKCAKDTPAVKIFKNNIYQPPLVESYLKEKYFSSGLKLDDFEKYFMLVDLQTWMVDHSLIRSDKVTMQFALEERVPILDHRLIELSARIPTKFKVNFANTKIIFKETFRDNLPDYLFCEPKRGWLSPAAKWLRGELKDFAFDVLSDDFVPDSSEFFDLKQARLVLQNHIESKEYNLQIIWLLISWQLWYKKYINNK